MKAKNWAIILSLLTCIYIVQAFRGDFRRHLHILNAETSIPKNDIVKTGFLVHIIWMYSRETHGATNGPNYTEKPPIIKYGCKNIIIPFGKNGN